MRPPVAIAIAVAILSVSPLSAQTDVSTTATATIPAATCCSVRVNEFALAPSGASARIVVQWLRSDGSLDHDRAFAVSNGDPSTVADNYLWGTGVSGQPIGFMRAVGQMVANETGIIEARFNKAVLRWLRDHGDIGATELNLP